MRNGIQAAALAAIAATLALPGPAEASRRGDRCAPVVEEQLDRLQLGPEQVVNISYQVRRYNNRRDTSRVQGILAWVELQGCRGKLVIDMSQHCRFKQAYTTYECSVPGVAAY